MMNELKEQAVNMAKLAEFISDFLVFEDDCFDYCGFFIPAGFKEHFDSCRHTDEEKVYDVEKIYEILLGIRMETSKNSKENINDFPAYKRVSYGRTAESKYSFEVQLHVIEPWHYTIRLILWQYLAFNRDGLDENSQYEEVYDALWALLHELDNFIITNQPMYALVWKNS